MEKCPICGKENAEGLVCPACGYDESRNYQKYMTLFRMEDNIFLSEGEMRREWKEKSMKEMLEGVSVCITGYEHEMRDGVLCQKAEHEIEIAKGSELSPDKVVWFGQEFAMIDVSEKLELRVVVKKNGLSRSVNTEFFPPKLNDFWHLGVKQEKGGRIKLLIGNDSIYTETESIPLVQE
jgi:hypothetical protein